MIPFLELKARYRPIKPEIDAAVARVLESTQFVLGDEVAAFEKELAAYSGAQHAAAAEVLSLPMFPEMTDEQIEQVSAAVHAVARQGAHVG